MKLDGKTAVVTGASRGIGRAIAALFELEGAQVVGCARQAAAGIDACDVTQADDVERFAASVRQRFGVPDIVVNNAGTVVRAPMDALAETEWDSVVGSNLKGTFLITRAFLGDMRARRRGRIINIASISGRLGTAGLVAYCAAKHGVVGLTRALAEEVRPDGLTVNAICPGSVDTDMLRVGMPGAKPNMTVDDVARVALFLAADAPAAMTGSCVDVFG
ncbi:MAG TPA: SDR family NAD(P)-dependent oxidoreductase [Polyangia bacterium]|jgi:NAD(P)-dependent dehydrogenase (short-subunit alcohol dehydrogenase family)